MYPVLRARRIPPARLRWEFLRQQQDEHAEWGEGNTLAKEGDDPRYKFKGD